MDVVFGFSIRVDCFCEFETLSLALEDGLDVLAFELENRRGARRERPLDRN